MIFGRHPAVIIGFLQAALFAVAQIWTEWSDAQVMAIVAVLVIVGDLVVAGFTRDTVLAVLVGLAKAGLAALLLFGVAIDEPTQASILSVLTALVAMLQMNATVPLAKFSLRLQGDPAPAA